MPARPEASRLVAKKEAARIAVGARQHVGRGAAAGEEPASAAAHAEAAALGALQQHEADHGRNDHEMNDDDDGLHLSAISNAPGQRRCSAIPGNLRGLYTIPRGISTPNRRRAESAGRHRVKDDASRGFMPTACEGGCVTQTLL